MLRGVKEVDEGVNSGSEGQLIVGHEFVDSNRRGGCSGSVGNKEALD